MHSNSVPMLNILKKRQRLIIRNQEKRIGIQLKV